MTGMELFKICTFVVLLLFCAEFLEKYIPAYGLLLILLGAAGVWAFLARWLLPLAEWMRKIAAFGSTEHFGILMKAAVIAFLTENVGEICADSGRSALRSLTELAGRCLIMLEALPLFVAAAEIFIRLLQN